MVSLIVRECYFDTLGKRLAKKAIMQLLYPVLGSLCLVAHKASTECLQFSLLAAAALASSHVHHPALFLSFSTVLRQVVTAVTVRRSKRI